LPGVEFHVGRVRCDNEISSASLEAMKSRLAGSLAQLLPGSALDVLAYACTSGTLLIGEQAVARALHSIRPGLPVTTPLSAAVVAFRALSARRIALLTPYVAEINERLRAHFERSGVAVTRMGGFFNARDPEVARIAPQSIGAAAWALADAADIDLLFIACTALRASALVPQLEAELGIAVTTSNHAMAWHALRLAGIEDRTLGPGRLFNVPLAAGDQ
jgi:maleate isomerase